MVHFYRRICIFLVGIIVGFLIGKSCINIENIQTRSYDVWFKNNGLFRKSRSWDTLRYKKSILKESVIESDFLFKKITILCMILLKNKKYTTPIKDTWAKGCNAITFIDIHKIKTIPIKRNIKDSSWVALCKSLQDANNFDWLLIVSDLTFVIMENLRYFLAPLSPENKYYLGYTVEFWKTFYNSKDGGIVISRGTLKTFKKNITKEECISFSYWNREDYYLGKSLARLNIRPVDTRDEDGFSLFYPHNLNSLIFNEGNHYKPSIFPTKCCSKHTVSFHALDGDKMYTYYYLLYSVQLFTEGHMGNIPNLQKDDDEVWKKFLRKRNITNYNISSTAYYQVWEDLINDPSSFAAKMKRETVEEL